MLRNFSRFAVLILVGAVAIAALMLYFNKPLENQLFAKRAEAESAALARPVFVSRLDGVGVGGETEQVPRVVGIMIDNHPDSRPASGLSAAPVVYEAPVEGGMTRYMAIFASSQLVERVGPVRSSRPYFLDWLSEYGDALYMHVGGSSESLGLIEERGVFDRDEFFWGSYYWRSRDRFAPYNVYTKSAYWQELWSKREKTATDWEGWKFSAERQATSTHLAQSVFLQYSPNYAVQWQYDSNTGKYYRFINNQPHIDAELGKQIQADNVIVQKTDIMIIDSYGRRRVKTIGSGPAAVFRQGALIEGVWKKESLGKRTRFYDSQGDEIALIPGKSWVQVAPDDIMIEMKK